jgi:hypothetical protein
VKRINTIQFWFQKDSVVNNYTVKYGKSNKIDALPLPVITRDSINTALSYEDASAKLRVVFMKPMLGQYSYIILE